VSAAATLLAAAGVEVLPFDGLASSARADLGVTGAAYAIAATGSVVLAAGAAGGRSAALVPPVHLALVDAATVVATPADLWRRLPERFPDGLPSQLVFASGPSRSADIEFTLTVGVHGPKVAWMAIS
jgi:L-lactate dehydrogenase complex protein LldG